MKILLVGPASPFRGGIANFNDSLCTVLDNKHDARIISFSLQYPSLLFPGRTQYEDSTSESAVHSINLINSINPFSWHSAAAEIAKMKPDCLVVHYWMPFFAPALGSIIRKVKDKIKVKTIGLLHNVEPHEGMLAGKRLGRYFFDSCDGFITMSSTVLSDLKNQGIDKPAILIPHPVYDIFGKPVSRQFACENLRLNCNQKHLLFFGIIRKYKGLDLLLEAFGRQRLSNLNIRLIVAGEFYEKERRYIDLVRKLGLKHKVIFTRGFVPKNKVAQYFAVSDLVVLPYLTATQSGVTQIAYHFNKPMLVTNVGGLKDVVASGKVGYVCEKDPDDIAAAIADFFENSRSSLFIENIKTEKKRFSWDAMVTGIEELYSEIKN